MRLSGIKEFSKVAFGCNAVHMMRFLRSGKPTKVDKFPVDPDSRLPNLVSWLGAVLAERNAFISAGTYRGQSPIAAILSVGCNPEVSFPVVETIPVSMVDLAFRKPAHESMHKNHAFPLKVQLVRQRIPKNTVTFEGIPSKFSCPRSIFGIDNRKNFSSKRNVGYGWPYGNFDWTRRWFAAIIAYRHGFTPEVICA